MELINEIRILKIFSWVINIPVVLLALYVKWIILSITALGSQYSSGGIAVLAPGIILLFLVPAGLLINLLLLYIEHKNHIKDITTTLVSVSYVLYISYVLLGEF